MLDTRSNRVCVFLIIADIHVHAIGMLIVEVDNIIMTFDRSVEILDVVMTQL